MSFLRKIKDIIFKNDKVMKNPWLEFYSKEHRTIRFTNKSIYDYMHDSIKDLDLYALNYFNTRITYREMFKNIDTISKSLCTLGVKKGDIVTICMPNTPEAVETFYAINKVGAVADMMHPLSSKKELIHYLSQSKSKILFLYDENYSRYKDVIDTFSLKKVILISVSESMPKLMKYAYKFTRGLGIVKPRKDVDKFLKWKDFLNISNTFKTNVTSNIRSKDLALILHSGGTTGTPKGIMISNYNFNALAQQGAINVINVKPKDKIMTILPIFHGFGLGVCVHCPLCLEVETILIPEFNAKSFYNTIKKYKPNVIAGVPTLWEGIISNKLFDNIDLSSLKYVISGGDILTLSMENKMNNFLRSHGANISISKGYGMTESVAATSFTFEGFNEPGSIGIPMINNSFCICKPNTTIPVSNGEEGEICVYGPTIMMGYFNNEIETKNVLKKHEDGHIWLHTGDLGYIAPNGVIYFTQRLKRIIVSSGFNLYPTEIENAICMHPKVKTCCVVGVPHKYKMNAAKAYIVLDTDNKLDNNELDIILKEIKQICKRELALYSQPKYFEFRDSLPQTLYKKIDFKALEEGDSENNG